MNRDRHHLGRLRNVQQGRELGSPSEWDLDDEEGWEDIHLEARTAEQTGDSSYDEALARISEQLEPMAPSWDFLDTRPSRWARLWGWIRRIVHCARLWSW